MPTNLDPDAQKKIIKEAIREWLDGIYTDVGRWTMRGLMAAALAGAVYLALRGQGWSKP